MSYDLHVVRTKHWTEAAQNPITEEEIDSIITNDPELERSTTDYVDMKNDNGDVTRSYMIRWRGKSCFWWYRGELLCSGPDDSQQLKLVQIAQQLNAYAVGDDGEHYQIKSGFLGKKKLVITYPDA